MKKIIMLLLVLIPINVQAVSEITIMDIDSGRILYESNANEKRLIASITKIMTAIVTIENMDIKKKITVGEEILKSYGTNTYIEIGEELTVEDLLYGLILRSGNDAAMTLAVNVAQSEEEFVELMNKKAEEIGMTNTKFQNPHGLDEETKNYSTSNDMAKLSRYASKNKIYRTISKTKKYTLQTNKKSYVWNNRNKLLLSYKNCTGGKNGYTPSAGKTLVTTAKKDNLNLTIVTLNDPDLYKTHESLYNYYFSKYKNYKIIDKETFTFDNHLFKNNPYIKESFSYPLTEEEKDNITTKIKMNNKTNGESGVIEIYLKDSLIGKVKVYAEEKEKEEKSLFQKIKDYL